jgi:uncharacterized protein YyaL (SSP411 family)
LAICSVEKGITGVIGALGVPFCVAAQSLDFLRHTHWREGRLLATSKDGNARLDAYLDDHALLIDAILALLTVRFESSWLQFAIALADTLLARFEDREHGGFFFTADDHESLIHRSRNFLDDATPSGNAIAAQGLQRLGWLLGESRYLTAAERTLRAAWSQLAAAPLGQVHMTMVLEEHLRAHTFVIVRGEQEQMEVWRHELQRIWRPHLSVLAIPGDTSVFRRHWLKKLHTRLSLPMYVGAVHAQRRPRTCRRCCGR